jgi:hypothetical protein
MASRKFNLVRHRVSMQAVFIITQRKSEFFGISFHFRGIPFEKFRGILCVKISRNSVGKIPRNSVCKIFRNSVCKSPRDSVCKIPQNFFGKFHGIPKNTVECRKVIYTEFRKKYRYNIVKDMVIVRTWAWLWAWL